MKLEEVELVESPVMERKAMSLPDSSEDEIEDKREEEIEVEDDEFAFSKFTSLHFQGSSTHSHIQQRLRKPLLYHEDEGDTLASVVLISIMSPFKARLDSQLCLVLACLISSLRFFLSPPGQFDSMVDHTKIYGRSSRAEARTCF